MHVSKFRAPFRSKLILIRIRDMHDDQIGIQIKEQCESAVIERTMEYNALVHTLGTVVVKPTGRIMTWILPLIPTLTKRITGKRISHGRKQL